jgi:chloride channel protein, CIC family
MPPAPDNAQSARPRPKLFLRWARRIGRSWVERARGGETVFFLFVAAAIGVLGGLGAIAFETAIHLFQDGLWTTVEPGVSFLRNLPAWKIALVPALGGLLVGLITTYFVAEAKGHGVPEVMKAVALRGGLIRGRGARAKTLTSAITIGSGGSAGREGPIIQIGAAIGSRIGQAMGMSKRRLRTLVGCGAAAGIAATFNAPVAGALFAGEVILGEFGAAQFSPIVISSVIATVTTRFWRGDVPAFSPPPCTFASARELLPYALLGLLCGLLSLAYIHINRAAEHFFEARRNLPPWLRPALGGLLVGLMALALPHVLGDGHWLANDAFAGRISGGLLLVLVFAKMLATGLTLGSGGSGGVFSPALAVGALLGAWVGGLAEPWLPGHFGGVAAYALVGMGGLIAGSMLAPITAILMVFEITSNYSIILPVMLVAILSTILVSRLTGHLSIYTLKLAREGIHLFRGRSPDLLQARHVQAHMRPGPETLPPGASARLLMDRMLTSEAAQFYVVDPAALLLGLITLADARRIFLSPPGLLDVLRAEDVMHRDIPHVLPTDSLSTALARFASSRLQELPVVQSATDHRLLGTLAYADVLAAYQEEILKADAPQAFSSGLTALSGQPVTLAPGFELVEWNPPAAYHGLTLAAARLPDTLGVRALLLKRPNASGQSEFILPDARSVLAPDDTLVLLGPSDAIARTLRA